MSQFLLNQKGELTRVNFSTQDSSDFVFDIQKAPVFKEVKNKDWVLWGYSQDFDQQKWNNLLPEYYEWLYNSSSKHRAIINRKVLFICGKGVRPEFQGLSLEDKVELTSFAFSIDDSELVKKLALNETKLGGFSYEVIPDKGGKKITAHYINIKNIRRSPKTFDEQGNELPCVYYYTSNWKAQRPMDNKDWKVFYPFDWTNKFESSKRYLVVQQDDEENIYPIPEYTAAIPYIAADYEVGNFTYNNTKNGFTAGWLVNFFNGDPDDDQREEIVNSVKKSLHGTDNAGEPVVSFQDNQVNGVEITSLSPNGQDDRFINLNKQIREEIFSGHTVDPVIVGLEGNNGFNNNADEKRTAIEDFQRYYVKGKQMSIERHLNAIRAFNGIKGSVYIAPLDPILAQFSAADVLAKATTDEARAMMGLKKLDKEPNQTADALGSMSPLLANKILEYMSPEQILALVGIKQTAPVVRTTEEVLKEFSNEEIDNGIITFLSFCGLKDEDYEVVSSKELFAKDIEDAEAQSAKFATRAETSVLSLIKSNPAITPAEISELTKIPVTDVNEIITGLKSQGLLTDAGNVTTKGNEAIEESELITVYKYEKRNDVSGSSIIETTRDFCRRLVTLSLTRSWTIDDIKRMRNGMGLDVFASRGGWYTIPGTDTHVPYCRHIWRQTLVRKKK